MRLQRLGHDLLTKQQQRQIGKAWHWIVKLHEESFSACLYNKDIGDNHYLLEFPFENGRQSQPSQKWYQVWGKSQSRFMVYTQSKINTMYFEKEIPSLYCFNASECFGESWKLLTAYNQLFNIWGSIFTVIANTTSQRFLRCAWDIFIQEIFLITI